MQDEPLTREWLLENGFRPDGPGFFKYVHDYIGLFTRNDGGRWHWRLEEHRDTAHPRNAPDN